MIRTSVGLLLTVPIVVCGCVAQVGEAAPVPPPAPTLANATLAKAGARASNDFGMRLLQATTKQKPGANVFLSPTSVSQALGMAYAGSAKQTQAQMAKVLGLPLDRDAAGKQQAALLLALAKPTEKVTLNVANAIWSSNQYPFNPDFSKRCAAYYSARAASLDFHQPASADTINRWVSSATQGKIPTLVSPSTIRDASAVLTNAVYFKGRWQEVFDKSETEAGPFTPEKGAAFSVPLMHRTGEYAFATSGTWDMAVLPYGTGRFRFVTVLPHKGVALTSVVNQLNGPVLAAALSKAGYERLALGVPRFKVTYAETLNEPLKALGMPRAFEGEAEFEPMFTRGSHLISAVVHKTVLEVKEEGAEAAAATGVVAMAGSAMPRPPREFILNRPFACFIVDGETGAVVFAGAVYHPDVLDK